MSLSALEKARQARNLNAPATIQAPAIEAPAIEAPAADKAAELARLLASFSAPAIDEAHLVALIKKHATLTYTLEVKEKGQTTRIEGAHAQLEGVVRMLGVELNVYLVGPAGSGKTTLAKQAAAALGLPFHYTGAILQKYELTGFMDAQGQLVRTPFRDAYENGGLFLFDELDACAPEALTAFNGALANGLCAFPDGVIKQHPDFRCVATGNTLGTGSTGDYSGRSTIDGATLDRFAFVKVDYCESTELAMAQAEFVRFGGDAGRLSVIEKAIFEVRKLRKVVQNQEVSAIISPRASIAIARLLAAGVALDSAIYAAIGAKMDANVWAHVKAGV